MIKLYNMKNVLDIEMFVSCMFLAENNESVIIFLFATHHFAKNPHFSFLIIYSINL